MKHSFLRLTDYSKNEFKEIFQIADELKIKIINTKML